MKHLPTLLSLILCSISITFAEYDNNYLDLGIHNRNSEHDNSQRKDIELIRN